MRREEMLPALGRQAHRVAGQIRLLAEHAEAAGMNADGFTWDEVRSLADTFHGMAYACAFEVEDMDLLFELTGRRWGRIDPSGGGR